MKKTLALIALAAASFAASATTVGIDYGYAKSTDGPYVAGHSAVASIKQGFGALGNVKLSLGGVQAVTGSRDNGVTFGVEYSYDFKLPFGTLSPEVSLNRVTGTANPSDFASVGATLRVPTNVAGARFVTGVDHTHALGSDSPNRSTTVGVGVEYDWTKSMTLKAGYAYSRLHTTDRNANGFGLGIDFKF